MTCNQYTPMRVTVEPKILMSQLLKSAVFIFRRLKGVHWFLARSLTFKSWTLILANLWYRLINTTHFSSTPNISLSCELVQQAAADWLQLTDCSWQLRPLTSSRSPILGNVMIGHCQIWPSSHSVHCWLTLHITINHRVQVWAKPFCNVFQGWNGKTSN